MILIKSFRVSKESWSLPDLLGKPSQKNGQTLGKVQTSDDNPPTTMTSVRLYMCFLGEFVANNATSAWAYYIWPVAQFGPILKEAEYN